MTLNDFFQTDTDQKKPFFQLDTTHDIIFSDNKHLCRLPANSVHLVVTSPPYGTIKDYGHRDQIGYGDSPGLYFDRLRVVWYHCIRLLKPGCKLVINIGNQFLKKTREQEYQTVPLHEHLVSDITRHFHDKIIYLGSIIWKKVSTSNTSGGGKAIGSVYYPRNGHFLQNREYIAVFKKRGKDPRPGKEIKEASRLTRKEWQTYFNDTWTFPGCRQDEHVAMFPEELASRIIKMYSFAGDTVLDPFLGSGTTTKVAALLGRNSTGFEIGFTTESGKDWKEVIREKVTVVTRGSHGKPSFRFHDSFDSYQGIQNAIDLAERIKQSPDQKIKGRSFVYIAEHANRDERCPKCGSIIFFDGAGSVCTNCEWDRKGR
ncbi:MAG: DNA-methyltransferase [Candidatus Odinarchaeota archaeon]